MTETMYARDLRVIQWPQQDASFDLVDDDGRSWFVTPSTEQGRWWGADPDGEVWHDGHTEDEVIYGIIGDPQDATEWEVYTLGRLIELGWMSGGSNADEDTALANLTLLGLAVKIEQDRRMVWRSTDRGVAKAAMLG